MSVSTEGFAKDKLSAFRSGDTERVLSVAFHPNKQYMAFGCENSSVKLWNVRSKLYVSIVPHMGNVQALQFSYDGTLLCSASSGHAEGNTLCLWECVHDVKDDEDMSLRLALSDTQLGPRRLEVLHQDDITGVAFAPTRGKAGTVMLASCSRDSTVRLWLFPPNKKMNRQALRHHRAAVNAVTFSDDGKYIVSGGEDGEIVFGRLLIPDTGSEENATAGVKEVKQKVVEEDKQGNTIITDATEHLELAEPVEFMMVFRFNCFEPVFDVRFFPGFEFVTLVGSNVRENGPDRQYQLVVGTSTSVCLLKLHDTHLPMYEDSDIVDHLIDTAEQDVRRTRLSDDTEVSYAPRKVNYAQISLQFRQFLGSPVRSVMCAAIAAKAPANDSTQAAATSFWTREGSQTMTGFLKVKTDKIILGNRLWKKLYYAVDVSMGQLLWFKNELMSGAPRGFIRLETVRSVRLVKPKPGATPKARFKIKVIGGETTILEAVSRPLMQQWIDAIENGRDALKPQAMVMCAAVGEDVRAFTLQSAAHNARKPTRQQMRAETLVPLVFQTAQTTVGKHDDQVNAIALPSEDLQRKIIGSGLIENDEFLTASASVDQTLRLFKWSLLPQEFDSDSESEDESAPDPDGLRMAPPEEGNYRFGRQKMLFLPASNGVNKSWVKLERPLTQSQLTARVAAEAEARENRTYERDVAPETARRGEPRPADISHLRLTRDRDMEEDSEEDFDLDDLGIPDDEDENTVMEALSRRLLGGVQTDHGVSEAAISVQAVPRPKLETVAEKLMERAEAAGETDEQRALAEADDKVTGHLASFARMAARQEVHERVNDRESCTGGDCTVL